MKNFIINLLFKLLGNSEARLYNIDNLFGGEVKNHDLRKKRWERALSRMWKDKDLIDYLYYQAESDKENYFRGKIIGDLSRGARIRTLFLAYSARMAFENELKSKRSDARGRSDSEEMINGVKKSYKDLTDIVA